MLTPVSRMMDLRYRPSRGEKKAIVVPVLPARPVRPLLCRKFSTCSGGRVQASVLAVWHWTQKGQRRLQGVGMLQPGGLHDPGPASSHCLCLDKGLDGRRSNKPQCPEEPQNSTADCCAAALQNKCSALRQAAVIHGTDQQGPRHVTA